MNGRDEVPKGMTASGASGSGLAGRRVGTSDRLRNERARLEARLKEVKEALSMLEANPEVADLIDSLARLGHFE